MAAMMPILLFSAIILSTTGVASHSHNHTYGYSCSHDEVVEPYHKEILQQLSAVPQQSHISLNSQWELGWQPGQEEMMEKEAQQNRIEGVTAQGTTEPQTIRITVDYQLEKGTPWPAMRHLKKRLVPQMIASLQRYIKVKNPVGGKLKLPRQCAQQSGDWTCRKAAPIANCGSVAKHKAEYFGDFVECGGPGGCKYLRGGEGLKDTDFLLYVTSRRTSHCSRGLLAFAGYCTLDPTSNRPLAGFANFCPNALTNDPDAFQAQLETAVHEALHALAFSTTLFSHFIGKDGEPLGRRKVIQSYDDDNGNRVQKIITPTVVREARKHFNCPTLNGAELENEGGPGIAGSHWESRIFQYEIMDGQAGNNMEFERHVVTRLTLAALEDTGWYEANWHAASTLMIGRDAGCSFLNNDCTNPSKAHQDFYCTSKEDKCVWDRTAQGTCDEDYFLMDGCSYTRPYMNTVCTNPDYLQPSAELWGQGYGAQSRCMEHDTSESFARRSVGVLTPAPLGCYEMECDRKGKTVFLKMFGQYIKCPPRKYVELRNIPNVDFISGSIGPCPAPSEICPALGCPGGCSSHGRCVDGECECHLGFAGWNCSIEACTADSCASDEICSSWSGLCRWRDKDELTPTLSDLPVDGATPEEEDEGTNNTRVQLANGDWVDVIDLEYAAPEHTFEMFIGVDKQLATEKATVKEIAMTVTSPAKSLNSLTLPIASAIGALCAFLLVALGCVMRMRASLSQAQDKDGGEKSKGNPPEGADVESSGPAEKHQSLKDTEVRMGSVRSICTSDRSGLDDSVIHAEGVDLDDFQGAPELSRDSRDSFYSVESDVDGANSSTKPLVLSPSRLSAMSTNASDINSSSPRSAKTKQHGVIFPNY